MEIQGKETAGAKALRLKLIRHVEEEWRLAWVKKSDQDEGIRDHSAVSVNERRERENC